jgi:hypothetical protein
VFFFAALREKQGWTEAVEAKKQEERKKQTPFKNFSTKLLANERNNKGLQKQTIKK